MANSIDEHNTDDRPSSGGVRLDSESARTPAEPPSQDLASDAQIEMTIRMIRDADEPVPVVVYDDMREDFIKPAQEPEPEVGAANADDESMEQYMSELMDRVGVDKSKLSTTKETPAKSAESSSEADSQAPADKAESEELGPGTAKMEMAISAAPEKSSVLSTMRAVANESAHLAVDTHTRRRLVQSAYLKLVLTNLLLIGTCGLLVWPPQGAAWAYPAAWTLLGIAMWMFWWYNVTVGLLTEAWATDRRKPRPKAPPTRDAESVQAPDVDRMAESA